MLLTAVSVAALIVSISVKAIGFPAQLAAGRKARREGLPPGMSSWLAGIMCASYAIWVLQGALTGNWALICAQGAGVVLTGLLFLQSRR